MGQGSLNPTHESPDLKALQDHQAQDFMLLSRVCFPVWPTGVTSPLSFNGNLKVQIEIKAQRLESTSGDPMCSHYPPLTTTPETVNHSQHPFPLSLEKNFSPWCYCHLGSIILGCGGCPMHCRNSAAPSVLPTSCHYPMHPRCDNLTCLWK